MLRVAPQLAWLAGAWARTLLTTGPLHLLPHPAPIITQVSAWMSLPQTDLLGQSVTCSPITSLCKLYFMTWQI